FFHTCLPVAASTQARSQRGTGLRTFVVRNTRSFVAVPVEKYPLRSFACHAFSAAGVSPPVTPIAGEPLVIVLVTIWSPATIGVGAVPDGWNGSGTSQLTDPSSGFRPTTRRVVMNTASGTFLAFPAAANSTGDDVLAGSSSACHWSSPVSVSNATTE